MSDDKAKFLLDEMNAAKSMGVLLTIQALIKLEIESGEEYTKDAATMDKLRHCWKRNEARVAAIVRD